MNNKFKSKQILSTNSNSSMNNAYVFDLNLKTAATGASVPDTVYFLGFPENSKEVETQQAHDLLEELINLIRMEEYINLSNIVKKMDVVKTVSDLAENTTDATIDLMTSLLGRGR